MVVRIRLCPQRRLGLQHIALAAESLLMPLALLAFTAGLVADREIWLAAAALLSITARALGHYANNVNATI